MPANTTITLRKGPASVWSSTNPILANGEPGYDTTNNILKIGDGINNWNNLSSINPKIIKESIILNSPSGTFNVSGGYTIGTLDIFLNGIKLSEYAGDYTANDGTTFSLTDIAPSGSIIEYMALAPNISSFSITDIIDLQDVLDSKISDTFETISKNLKAYPASLSYSSGELSSINYTTPSGTVTKTFNRSDGKLTSIVLSGAVLSGVSLTKTFGYSDDTVVGVTYG